MKLKHLSIQRQKDNTFAIVATVELASGFKRDVILESGAAKANDLQKAFTLLMNSEEDVQVEIQHKLLEAI